jgi:SNF2 family DNA or RNA helicase
VKITVKFDYSPKRVEAIKELPKDRRGFQPDTKSWWVDALEVYNLADLMKTADPILASKLLTGAEYAEARTVADAALKNIEASRAVDADIDIPLPAGLELYGFQKAGVNFMTGKRGILLADDLGIGKTIQCLALMNKEKPKMVLAIVKASIKINWAKEAQKWLVNPYNIHMFQANAKKPIKEFQSNFSDNHFYIINYDLLKKFQAQLLAMDFDLIVADESHYIKNYRIIYNKDGSIKEVKGAQRAVLAYQLFPKAKKVIFSTGTPIVNRPVELWPLIHALDPITWSHFFRYALKFCGAVQGKYGWDFSGHSNLDELHNRLRATLLIRRLKKDVLKELPPKIRQIIEIEPDGDELAHEAKYLPKTDEELKSLAFSASFEEMSSVRHETALAKVSYCINFIKDTLEEKDKIVIFAHHRDVIDQIYTHFKSISVKIVGGDTEIQRDKAITAFQNDPNVKLFIGSMKACGEGITLTAANTVIFCELDWVPSVMNQCEDRSYRIGTKDCVNVYHLVFANSIDYYLASVVKTKQEVIDEALDIMPEGTLDIAALSAEVSANEIIARAKQNGIAAPIVMKSSTPQMLDIEKQFILEMLRYLSEACDGAHTKDGTGFNKFDAQFGKRLATLSTLTDKQAHFAKKMLIKYRKQLSAAFSPAVIDGSFTQTFLTQFGGDQAGLI